MRFDQKTVLVTGAGSGIGRGIALRFAREGAKVAIMDNNPEGAQFTSKEITRQGRQALVVTADVSNPKEVGDGVAKVVEAYGGIDILVNNAGIRYIRRVLEMPDEEWERTIAVNLTGMFLMTKNVAPIMLKRASGKIISVASMSGFLGQSGRAAYGSTKAAIMQLTRSLAVELAPSINVNAVAPGYIAGTAMMAEVDRDKRSVAWMLANTPIGRAGTPEDVGGAVTFLASDDASFITGATLVVDGGFSISKHMIEGRF